MAAVDAFVSPMVHTARVFTLTDLMHIVLVVGCRRSGKSAVVWDAVQKLGHAAIGFPLHGAPLDSIHDETFPHVILDESARSGRDIDDALTLLRSSGKVVAIVDHNKYLARKLAREEPARFDALVCEFQYLSREHRNLLRLTDEVLFYADWPDPVTKEALQAAGFAYNGDATTWQRWTRL